MTEETAPSPGRIEVDLLTAEGAADALPALAALLVDAVDDGAALGFLGGLTQDSAEAWWSREALPELGPGRSLVFAAFDADLLLGAALVRPDLRPAAATALTLQALMVHTGARRRGAGRALLAALTDQAQAAGKTLILAEVATGGSAERLLSSAGWSRIGRVRERMLLPDGSPVTVSLMERRLGPRAVQLSTRVRGARIEDSPRIGEIHVRAWQHAYRDHMPDEFLDQLDAELRESQMREKLTYALPADRVWVVDRDGELLAFAVTGTSRDPDAVTGSAELFSLYVDPDVVGAGLGRMLLAHALADVRRRGARSVTAWVLEGPERGRRLLGAAGFREEAMERSFTAMGEVLREQRMRLVVSPGA